MNNYNYVYISTIEELEGHIASTNKGLLIVGGSLVYVTSDKSNIDDIAFDTEDYIIQPPRNASRTRILEAGRHNLYLGVDKYAAPYLDSYKHGVAFLADQYLAYGLSLKTDVIVIGGGAAPNGLINIEVYVFTGQKLIKTEERNIEYTGQSLDIATKDLIATFPNHSIHWCSPLVDPPFCDFSQRVNFVEVHDAPMKSIVKKKVSLKASSSNESLGLIRALAIVLIGVVVFAVFTGLKWTQIQNARSEFNDEIKGYEDVYSNSSHSLDLLRHRDFLLNSKPEHLVRVKNLDSLLAHIASIPNVKIKSVAILDSDSSKASESFQESFNSVAVRTDFEIMLTVPQRLNMSARDQALPMLANLNSSTGMIFQLLDHSEQVVGSDSNLLKYWQYRLIGAIE